MKGNFKSLIDLAEEVERIEEVKQDFLVSNDNITMVHDDHVTIAGSEYGITNHAHGQIASKLNIPKAYYDRMQEIEGLRTLNVNAWLREKSEKPSFVRTLDGNVRALLSNSYRPIDNYDILSMALPVFKDMNLTVKSSSLSETRLYVQLIMHEMEAEVKKGDVVRWGMMLVNSEVGQGAVDAKGFIERCWCDNGAITQSYFRKTHLGGRINGDNADMFQDDTRKAELQTIKLMFRDTVNKILLPETFEREVAKLKKATEDEVVKVESTVENVTKRFGINQEYNNSIIQNMAEEKNYSRYGIFNGITALAKSIENVDEQYRMEKIGGMIINMSRNEWGKYVQA